MAEDTKGSSKISNKVLITPQGFIDALSVALDVGANEIDFERFIPSRINTLGLLIHQDKKYIVKAARHQQANLLKRARIVNSLLELNNLAHQRVVYIGCQPEILNNQAFVVTQYIEGVDGRSCLSLANTSLTRTFFQDLAAYIKALHRIPVDGFSRQIQCESFIDWHSLVISWVDQRIELLSQKKQVDDELLGLAKDKIHYNLKLTGRTVQPSLVHGDIYLDNILCVDARVNCLIDYDHAKYIDPVFDLIKLKMWVFDDIENSESIFMEKYLHENTIRFFEERLSVCMGIELLGALNYFDASNQADSLSKSEQFFKEWLG